jgi:hypothetical protein
MKKYIIRASEVIEYVGRYEANTMDEAKQKFSGQVSDVTWYDYEDVHVEYSGFQWDICEEVDDDKD